MNETLRVHVSDLVARTVARREASVSANAGEVDDVEAVILLVDMVESTRLAERFAVEGPIGAERLHALLNGCFGLLFDTVRACGGDIVHVDGDATLAVWPIDLHGPNATVLAAHAACEVKRRFQSWRPDPGLQLRHRFCIAAGALNMVLCEAGPKRRFLVPTGQPLREAASALGLAGEDEVLVTRHVHEALRQSSQLSCVSEAVWRLDRGPFNASVPDAGERATTDEAHDDALSPFVSHVVAEGRHAGQPVWLSEFRTLSMVYVRIGAHGAVPSRRMADGVACIHAAVDALGAVVCDVIVGDKGLVVVVGCGLPFRAQEANADRALESALRAGQALRLAGLQASIGVATGSAFCGDVGSASRRHYLMNGTVMYRAARLMQSARDAIIVDDATVKASTNGFLLTPLASLRAKGFGRPVPRYALNAALPRQPGRLPFGPLRGREKVHAQLSRSLEADDPDRSPVLIEGEPGAGKSHLMAQLLQDARERGQVVASMACSPFEAGRPFAAAGHLLRALLGEVDGDASRGAGGMREALLRSLGERGMADKLPLIEDLLQIAQPVASPTAPLKAPTTIASAAIPTATPCPPTGEARFVCVEDIMVHVAERAGAGRGLSIGVDDLHWMDDASAHLLLGLSRRLRGARIILASRCVADHEGPHARALRLCADPVVQLERLDAAAIHAIVRDTLKVDTVPRPLRAFMVSRAAGLPFHAQQLALSLLADRAVTVRGRDCRLSGEGLPAQGVPSTVKELIVARIDRLPASAHRLIKVASVVHGAFSAAMLRAMRADLGEPGAVDHGLSELVGQGVMLDCRDAVQGWYVFSHAFIREAVYELLPFEQRRALHAGAARWLETDAGAIEGAFNAELAEHWERACMPSLSLRYRKLAAERAVERFAHHDALMHIAAFLRVAASSDAPLSAEERAHMARLHGDACHGLSRFEEADVSYRQCAALMGVAVPRGRAAVWAGIVAEGARQLARRAGVASRFPQGPRRETGVLAAHLFTRLAEHAYFNDRTAILLHATLSALNHAERAGAVRQGVEGLGGMAIGLGVAGMNGVAGSYARHAVSLARAKGTSHDEGFAHLLTAVYAFQAGRWREATLHAGQGAELCARLGDRFREQTCVALLGYVFMMTGRHDQAESCFARFGAMAEDVDNAPVRSWFLAGWAMLELRRGGSPARALGLVDTALSLRLRRAEQVLCTGVEAMAWLQSGQRVQALRSADTALDLMREGVPTMGIAVASVGAMADVHLALQGRLTEASQAVRAFARRTVVCQPLAMLARGHLAQSAGYMGLAAWHWRAALGHADTYDMPLERARCHLALASVSRDAARRARHRRQADEITVSRQFGAWFRALEVAAEPVHTYALA